MMANLVEHGKTPFLTGKQLEDLGYKIVIYPVSTIYAVTQAINDLLISLRKADTTLEYSKHMVTFADFNNIIGFRPVQDKILVIAGEASIR